METFNFRFVGATWIPESSPGMTLIWFHIFTPEPRMSHYYNRQQEVRVRFPRARSECKEALARYAGRPGLPKDDLILLQLSEPALELPTPAPLGAANDDDYPGQFELFGIARSGVALGQLVHGEIDGLVTHANSGQANDLVQLTCRKLFCGMSGSAVVDRKRNVVIGILISRIASDTVDFTAHAVDAGVLLKAKGWGPARDWAPEINQDDLPLAALAPFVKRIAASTLGDRLEDAPDTFREFVPRRLLLKDMAKDWSGPEARVIALTGIGGEGKTSLARRWLEEVSPKPQGRFWWPCYQLAEPDKLLSALLTWLTGGKVLGKDLPLGRERVQVILSLLEKVHAAVVIDGFEVLQQPAGDHFGDITDSDLKALFVGFCQLQTRSRLVVTTPSSMPITRSGSTRFRPPGAPCCTSASPAITSPSPSILHNTRSCRP